MALHTADRKDLLQDNDFLSFALYIDRFSMYALCLSVRPSVRRNIAHYFISLTNWDNWNKSLQ
jgi:hypothetical protein